MTVTTLCLTGDELTAISHCLGVPRFPGVLDTVYEAVDPELHPLLDGRFLAVLLARGLVHADDGGDLWPDQRLGALLDTVSSARTYIAVEQRARGAYRLSSIMAGDGGLLRDDTAEPLHRIALEPRAVDPDARLAAVLSELVDRSPGEGRSDRRRRWGRRSQIADLVPPPAAGWRRTTVLARTDSLEEPAYVEGFLAILDGGPGELWLGIEDDRRGDLTATATADPTVLAERAVLAEPASAGDIDAAVRAFAVHGRAGVNASRVTCSIRLPSTSQDPVGR